jgi:hypothetical protein
MTLDAAVAVPSGVHAIMMEGRIRKASFPEITCSISKGWQLQEGSRTASAWAAQGLNQ